MRTLPVLVITLITALFPICASGALLVGFHKRDTSGPNPSVQSADFAASGWSGSMSVITQRTTEGSTDETYGSLDTYPTPGVNDGYFVANSDSKRRVIVTITKLAGASEALPSLVFDAVGAPAVLDYSLDGVNWLTSLVVSGPGASGNTFDSPLPATGTADYDDYFVKLSSISLAANESIRFRFTATGSVNLDNIALISAIPETASFLALSSLMLSGAFFRNRRQSLTLNAI